MNLIDSHASLQSSHSCKLNTVACFVELTYLHVVVKCESLLGGHGKARCTVKLLSDKLNLIQVAWKRAKGQLIYPAYMSNTPT